MFTPRPKIESLDDLVALIATRIECRDAPEGYKPPSGWHSIKVDTIHGGQSDPQSLREWSRLFNIYTVNRKGVLIWADAPYFDRERWQIVARFCIDPKIGEE